MQCFYLATWPLFQGASQQVSQNTLWEEQTCQVPWESALWPLL